MQKLFYIFLLSFIYSAVYNVPESYSSIQIAIDSASNNDTVFVSAGIYQENINLNGKNILLLGEDLENTIIDGNYNGSVVKIENGENSNCIISNFTIKNGVNEGGGIYVDHASPIIKNCIITNNTGTPTGGGVFANADHETGLPAPTFQNCLIYGNTATVEGGGMKFHYSRGNLVNCNVVNNTGGEQGTGGIRVSVHPIEVVNSIIYYNESPQFNDNVGEDFEVSIITYSNIEGLWSGTGNFDSDPLFVDYENGNYTLQESSPCIDAGNPSSDFDPDGTIADMGAYYFHQIPGCADESACNYSEEATIDDGTCEYNVDFCGVECGDNSTCTVITDIDGNTYGTVQIGEQLWMRQNLKTTHYNNGDEIPTGLDDYVWFNTNEGAYSIYNNEPSNAETYGNLYNGYAVEDERDICPGNYHPATEDEWISLIDFLGGESIAGGKMKDEELGYWISPNSGATNESGFTAFPAGNRWHSGQYADINYEARYWSSAEDSVYAWDRRLSYSNANITRNYNDKKNGYSVRCLANVDVCISGDLNDDQEINVTDVVILIQIILGNQAANLCAGDMNEDEEINIFDVVMLINNILDED